MHLDNPFGTAISVYLTLVAGFAAIAATNAIEEDDRPNLPRRVGQSVTLTSLCLGAGAVVFLFTSGGAPLMLLFLLLDLAVNKGRRTH